MKQSTAIDILKSGNNVFITGSAGTGKTHLLNQFISYLKERKIIPTIIAPTGIAASHIKGQTIHSYFAIGIQEYVSDMYIASLLEKKYLKIQFDKLKILIIDEVSMVSPELFSVMDSILRAFKDATKPYGGVQVVLSGDFFQLPPISKIQKEKRFAWQSSSWKDLALKTCYLQKTYRHDDDKLIKILNEIREGNISTESQNLLHSRYHKELNLSYTPTKLYTHNIDVDRINQEELQKLPSASIIFKSQNDGSKANIEKIFKSSLVSQELSLKKDAVVMFIKNHPEKGYLNGTTAKVIGFSTSDNLPIVELSNKEIIHVTREDWQRENDNGEIVAKVSQLPLKLAWAITIHKSQGMTLDAAEIDLSKTFETGQGYVALSRIRNIEGLKLMGLNETAFKVDPLILHVDSRIKTASEKAIKEIEAVSREILESIFDSYIHTLGGITDTTQIEEEKKRLASQKTSKVKVTIPTYTKTKNLIESSPTLDALAKNREVTVGTIITHLTRLKKEDPDLDLEKYRPDAQNYEKIKSAVALIKSKNNQEDFTEDGSLRLSPIFNELNSEVSYDDIKIALLFLV